MCFGIVVLIRKGNQVFAFVHTNVEQGLKNQNSKLTLKGREIKVIKSLNEAEYQELIKLSEMVKKILNQNEHSSK